jgi:hypothetical protein
LLAGPDYLLDVVELSAGEEHLLELPLHLRGQVEVRPPGSWEPVELRDEFVERAERHRIPQPGSVVLEARGQAGASLTAHLVYPGDLLRARGPGAPGEVGAVPFYLIRSRGQTLRIITAMETGTGSGAIRKVREADNNAIEVETSSGVEHHVPTVEGWEIRSSGGVTRLAGLRRQPKPFEPLVQRERPLLMRGVALAIADPPLLDGSMEGFDSSEPLHLDHEDQYRRSEEPYSGPDDFSAIAIVNWSDESLYLAVEVMKSNLVVREPDTPPMLLDNEPDEIHADGIQVYLRPALDEPARGYLIVPSTHDGELISRGVSGLTLGDSEVTGAWQATGTGYRITIAITPPSWGPFRPGDEIGFDLLVNEMLPKRMRRAGQLVWSGGGGWVWLRGDRQNPERFGALELR